MDARHGTEWYVPFCSMSTRLWLAVLCGYLALGATIQALPAVVDGSPGAVGLLVTLAAAATAIARPFAGPRPPPGGGGGAARAPVRRPARRPRGRRDRRAGRRSPRGDRDARPPRGGRRRATGGRPVGG